MANLQSMSIEHEAVLVAVCIGKFKGCPPLKAANKLLRDRGHEEISQEKYERINQELICGGVYDNDYNLLIKTGHKPRSTSIKNPKRYVEERRLPKNIHLINKPVLRSLGITVKVVFNVNDDGDALLPNGKKVPGNLQNISDDMVKEYGATDTESKGFALRWYIDVDHHPTVEKNTIFKDWVDENYPIKEE